jgi:hypothetical protein
MPELPDLVHIVKALGPEIEGRRITRAEVKNPIVLRVLVPGSLAELAAGYLFWEPAGAAAIVPPHAAASRAISAALEAAPEPRQRAFAKIVDEPASALGPPGRRPNSAEAVARALGAAPRLFCGQRLERAGARRSPIVRARRAGEAARAARARRIPPGPPRPRRPLHTATDVVPRAGRSRPSHDRATISSREPLISSAAG